MADAFVQSIVAALAQSTVGTPDPVGHVSGTNPSVQTASAVLTGAVSLATAPTAGNLLTFVAAFDKDPGVVTVVDNIDTAGTSWTVTNLRSTSVSITFAWKVAAGGETTVTENHAIAAASGNTLAVDEWFDVRGGSWAVLASATHNTDESTVTSWSTGTTAAPAQSGLAIAVWGVDSGTSTIAPTVMAYSGGFAERHNNQTGGGRGSVFSADKVAASGSAVESTLSYTGGVADQWSGLVVVLGRQAAGSSFAVSGTIPTTSATTGTAGLLAAASSTTTAVSTATGAPTLVPPAASGTVTGVSQVTGTPAALHPVSGTLPATSATTGTAGGLVPVTGTTTATSSTSGSTAARLAAASTTTATSTTAATTAALLAAAGTIPAVTTTSGSAGTIGGAQTYPVTGTIAATTTTTGSPTSRQGTNGTTTATTSTTGGTTGLGAAAGTTTTTTTLTGATRQLLAVTGAAAAATTTLGDVAVIVATPPKLGEPVAVTLAPRLDARLAARMDTHLPPRPAPDLLPRLTATLTRETP